VLELLARGRPFAGSEGRFAGRNQIRLAWPIHPRPVVAFDPASGPRDPNQRSLSLSRPDLGDQLGARGGFITYKAELTQRVSDDGCDRFIGTMRTSQLRKCCIQDEHKLLIAHTATTLSDEQVPKAPIGLLKSVTDFVTADCPTCRKCQ
jgi:hypothetical protein